MSETKCDVVYIQKQDSEELELSQIDDSVGGKIRFYRKKLGFSQETLAKMLNISAQQLQKYEKGVNRVSASRLFILSKFLKIKIQDLFSGVLPDYGLGLEDNGQRFFDMEDEDLTPEQAEAAEAKDMLKLYYKIKDPKMRAYLKAIMQGLIVEDKIKSFHE